MNYIHEIFREYLKFFVMMYVNDILIFSINQKKHNEHVRFVFEQLRQYELFAKLNKIEFNVQKMIFFELYCKNKKHSHEFKQNQNCNEMINFLMS